MRPVVIKKARINLLNVPTLWRLSPIVIYAKPINTTKSDIIPTIVPNIYLKISVNDTKYIGETNKNDCFLFLVIKYSRK